MGAGSSTDHYMQDAAEAYIVFKLQELAVENDVALTDDVGDKFATFMSYCSERGISQKFGDSIYKENLDVVIVSFFQDLIVKYLCKKFDVVYFEKDFRDLKLKGDFAIYFSKDDYVSISPKNYKNGFDRIQLCFGTWNSFLTACCSSLLVLVCLSIPSLSNALRGLIVLLGINSSRAWVSLP